MISYELAKQLKYAGFPFKNEKYPLYIIQESLPPLQVPTLEELIEACGEKFQGLFVGDNGVWTATTKDMMFIQGLIPSSAVAKLWLELNKKL